MESADRPKVEDMPSLAQSGRGRRAFIGAVWALGILFAYGARRSCRGSQNGVRVCHTLNCHMSKQACPYPPRPGQSQSQSQSVAHPMALAPRRGLREDQRRDALPVAGRGSRGQVLESLATTTCDKAAALKLMKRLMKRYGRPEKVVTDGLRSYGAAMKELGNAERQEVGRWLNNRAENSHQPFRRRERAMERFRRMKTLQKFAAVHGTVHNHFNQERHLISRDLYRERRSAALAEWREVMG